MILGHQFHAQKKSQRMSKMDAWENGRATLHPNEEIEIKKTKQKQKQKTKTKRQISIRVKHFKVMASVIASRLHFRGLSGIYTHVAGV